ncbi:AAA family ATPase [Pseudoalteromonas sp. C2R02]|uniref:gluconokinase n=1 Tax=Pseudoalteromonas sp. C2R02 TaxID=2841565 RepID=UPI001C0A5C66|nr:gluconokinase, GntK/IdnK-type [Pseudoalteromonas sp. C2R02]MBU2968884.1 AAA family ATPase [Pseudoalteromonas sp. C2R02]
MTKLMGIHPKLIIVMGVSGCGKSTIAQELAQHLCMSFIDADDFHSSEAKSLMSLGTPLSDEMRLPWVNKIKNYLADNHSNDQGVVLAFSGLKKQHRNMFRMLFFDICYFHLYAPFKDIHHRLDKRKNHFFCSKLLASQYAALESTVNESDVTEIDANLSVAKTVETIQVKLLEGEYVVSNF